MDTPRWNWKGNEIAPEVDWNTGKDGGGSGSHNGGSGGNRNSLVIDEDYYYYSVKVVTSSNAPVSGAVVEFSNRTGVVETVTTGSDGCAVHIEPTNNDYPERFDCVVRAIGYKEQSPENGVVGSYNQQEYTYVQLEQDEGKYYYSLSVVDRTSREPIPNVTVERYNINQVLIETTVTDGEGFYIYQNNEGGRLYFKVKKNGYKDSNLEYIVGTTNFNDVKLFRLERDPQANYYYVIAVKDNAGNPVVGAKVKTYKDFARTQAYSSGTVARNQADDEIFFEVCSKMSSILNIDISSISLGDDLVNDFGVNQEEMTELMSYLDSLYGTQTISSDFGDLNTVQKIVDYIKTSGTVTSLPVTIHTTDSNGLINVSNKAFATQPNPIYVKGISVPSGYSWAVDSGSLPATLSPTTPGVTLTTTAYAAGTYYHNFVVVDKQTQQALPGAEVTYTDANGNILVKKTSLSTGVVQYSNKTEYVYVSVTKNGYTSTSRTKYKGKTTNDRVSPIYISQKRTVQVVYEDGTPAPKMTVGIFKTNPNPKKKHKPLKIARYKTYETGYIDYLGDDVYNDPDLKDMYAEVMNYATDPDKPEDKAALRKSLFDLNPAIVIVLPPFYDDGGLGYNEFDEFNEVSVSRIKNNISLGNQEIDEKGVSKRVAYNTDDFRIEILDPDAVTTYDIFSCIPIVVNNHQKNVIGAVDIDMKQDINDLKIKTINRYSGYYNPIFKDILFYKNLVDNEEECPYSNTEFDESYEDNLGKFGIIDHMWFHKANNQGQKIITSLTPYYPLTGQYALDNREYNIFESNWDMDYYTRQLTLKSSDTCENIGSMKDNICMFGSKYLNVPNKIEICGFDPGEGDGEWNDDWITNPDACSGEVMIKEINDNSVNFYFFIRKRILRYFREMLKEEFEKYIGSDYYSFGKPGVDDDIDEYVSKNVLKLYKLEKIRVFIRRIKKGQHNSRIENNYTEYMQYIPDPKTDELVEITKENLGYFKSHGFVERNNVTITKMNSDDFDRKLVYNLRNGMQEYFGFSFLLKKI